jgi:site-specific DNA-methyltransferase (adenine-specific)
MIKLLNMDCMEYMAGLPDKAFELAIVDPPFGMGDKLTTGGTWAAKYKTGDADWDKAPSDIYFNELFRVSKHQIIWGGNYFSLPPSRGFLIWDKVSHMETMADCEQAWMSIDKNAKIFKHVRNTSEARIHMCQKPVALYEWLLTNYAKPGDRILDTHLGSGSSAIAANNLGFDFVGMELDTDYYAAACKRFEQHKAQASLFQPDDYDRVVSDYQQQEML